MPNADSIKADVARQSWGTGRFHPVLRPAVRDSIRAEARKRMAEEADSQ